MDTLHEYKADRPVVCNYCGESVKHRMLQRHFYGDCASMPPIKPGTLACSACQEIQPDGNFANRNGRGKRTRNTTCRGCNKARGAAYRLANPLPERIPKHRRPGRWVLRPCPHCQEKFSARQLLKHKPRCTKNTTGYGPKVEFTALSGQEAIKSTSQADGESRHRDANFRAQYGITLAEYNRMLETQSGKCCICGLPPDTTGHRGGRTLHVDHSHSTGEIRGLLCRACNHLVGNCRESVEVLAAAIRYLQPKQPVELAS